MSLHLVEQMEICQYAMQTW